MGNKITTYKEIFKQHIGHTKVQPSQSNNLTNKHHKNVLLRKFVTRSINKSIITIKKIMLHHLLKVLEYYKATFSEVLQQTNVAPKLCNTSKN